MLARSQTYELSLFIGGKRTYMYAVKQRDAGHSSDGVEQVHRSLCVNLVNIQLVFRQRPLASAAVRRVIWRLHVRKCIA